MRALIGWNSVLYLINGKRHSVYYLTIRLWARDFCEVIVDEAEGKTLAKRKKLAIS